MRFLLPAVFLVAVVTLRAEEIAAYLEPGRVIKISSPESGVVTQVGVKEGQSIKAGDLIVKLDTRVLEQEAAIAEEQARVLERRLSKLKKLVASKFASQEELARTESELNITRLRKKRTESQMERLTLRSPIDGAVTEVRYDVAESVPGPNEHVATVVQIEPLSAQFNVPVDLASKLRTGQVVNVAIPDRNLTLPGEVVFISPVATAVVNTVRIKVSLNEVAEVSAGTKCLLTFDQANLTR